MSMCLPLLGMEAVQGEPASHGHGGWGAPHGATNALVQRSMLPSPPPFLHRCAGPLCLPAA